MTGRGSGPDHPEASIGRHSAGHGGKHTGTATRLKTQKGKLSQLPTWLAAGTPPWSDRSTKPWLERSKPSLRPLVLGDLGTI